MLVNMRTFIGPDLSDDDIDDVFDHVTRILSIHMDMGAVIEGAQYVPWLEKRRSTIDWRLWSAYSAYLAEHGRSPLVLDQLNKSLEKILDHMGDPSDQDPWERRGLVIGDVQSGKTSTYIGLMDKAADAGYRIFIVLTGNTESLRRQTQARVDEGMIGRDSAAALIGAKKGVGGNKDNRLGVGLKLESTSSVASTTTVLTDFRKSSAQAMNPSCRARACPSSSSPRRTGLSSIASPIGSRVSESGVENSSIQSSSWTMRPTTPPSTPTRRRRIRLRSTRRSVAFWRRAVATPTSVSRPPLREHLHQRQDDKDLFPRDFIYALDAPSNYHGATTLFGPSKEFDDQESLDEHPVIRILEDAEEYFPASHKSSLNVKEIPESLREALRTFLVANAIRDLRGEQGSPRSMLVNVSRFNLVQQRLGEWLAEELAAYRNAINSHAATFARGNPNHELEMMRETFWREYDASEFSWDDVLQVLPAAVAEIELKVVNSKRDKSNEEKELRDENAPRQISIGGDLLSRGLTLEGLMVSYFYRRTAASDTLMQMGRWFGYRDGYEDVCRLWLSAEVVSAYAYTADSLLELRLELERMRDQRLTPEQYGLAVANHPGALLITARNKMRSAKVGQKSISLRGRRPIESTLLSADDARVQSNLAAADELFASIESSGIESEQVGTSNRYIWRAVSKHVVASFLDAFSAADAAAHFQNGALSRFARNAQADDLQTWDVVLVGGSGYEVVFGSVSVGRPVRSAKPSNGNWVISGANRRVAGPGDVATPLTSAQRAAITAEYQHAQNGSAKRAPDTQFVQHLERPVLLVYPVQRKSDGETDLGQTLIATVVAVPGTAGVVSTTDQVTYWLNAVGRGSGSKTSTPMRTMKMKTEQTSALWNECSSPENPNTD